MQRDISQTNNLGQKKCLKIIEQYMVYHSTKHFARQEALRSSCSGSLHSNGFLVAASDTLLPCVDEQYGLGGPPLVDLIQGGSS